MYGGSVWMFPECCIFKGLNSTFDTRREGEKIAKMLERAHQRKKLWFAMAG